jgi:hypothetical protein
MANRKAPTSISRADIEGKLRVLQGDVQDRVEDQKSTLMVIAGVVGMVLIVTFYLLGRRSGRRKSTLVEIRRA